MVRVNDIIKWDKIRMCALVLCSLELCNAFKILSSNTQFSSVHNSRDHFNPRNQIYSHWVYKFRNYTHPNFELLMQNSFKNFKF